MKTILTGRIPTLFLIGCWLSVAASGQITFVKPAEGNANTRQSQQTQGGLSQEKKKSLSKYGPEDAFPGTSEQEGSGRRQPNKTNQRRPSAIPSPTITPTPAPTATPTPEQTAATPSPMASPDVPATNSINATSNSTTLSSAQTSGSTAVPITLAAAALLVFGALVYVVGSLRKKLKSTL